MYYELYIDVLYLSDFIMNFSMLCLTGRFCGKTATFRKKILASAYGAGIYCMVFLLPIKGKMLFFLLGMFFSIVGMARISFGPAKGKGLLKISGTMIGTALFQGGIYLFLKSRLPFLWGMEGLILPTLAAGGLSYIAGRFLFEKNRKKKPLFCRVKMKNGEKEVEINALLDTGNFLTEPISGKPVSVLAEDIVCELFDGCLPQYYRAIPFCSIGTERGILKGFEIPKLWIQYGEEPIFLENIMVACNDKMPDTDSCPMILNPRLIQELEK